MPGSDTDEEFRLIGRIFMLRSDGTFRVRQYEILWDQNTAFVGGTSGNLEKLSCVDVRGLPAETQKKAPIKASQIIILSSCSAGT